MTRLHPPLGNGLLNGAVVSRRRAIRRCTRATGRRGGGYGPAATPIMHNCSRGNEKWKTSPPRANRTLTRSNRPLCLAPLPNVFSSAFCVSPPSLSSSTLLLFFCYYCCCCCFELFYSSSRGWIIN